jgi:putative endopeptidase
MFKSILAAGASIAVLSLAAPATAQSADEGSDIPVMNYGSWGIDPATIDHSVDPGNDFFKFVNGKWVSETEIPAEMSRFGSFDALGEKARADVKDLVDELVAGKHKAGSNEQRIVDAYNAFLDTDAIDARGLAPTYPYLTKIFEAETLDDLVKLFAEPGFSSLVGGGVTVDSKQPDSYIVSVGFDGMGLPDRDYYLVDNDKNEEIREKYLGFLALMLDKAGYADPEAAAASVYGFERQVAAIEWDRAVMRNRDLTYNKLSKDELIGLSGDFPLALLIDTAGLSDQEYFLAPQILPDEQEIEELGLTEETLAKMGDGLPGMMKLVAETPLATLKAYMAAHFLNNFSAYLPSEIDDAEFEFYGKVLSGQEEQRPRWKRAIAATEGQLGEVLGEVYVEHYFPPESKVAMDELVANLRKAMAEGLAENDWMSAATKVEAEAKLDAFTPKIGYPVKFETYDGLEISADDPLGNAISAAHWAWNKDKSRLGQPVDRTEWFMLPQTVNAYYNSVMNEIVFPAAILQQPFFDLRSDPAVNYGAIGGVIGHEIGHGFDDQGSKSDGTGTLRNWWADSDLEAFTAKGDALVAQYEAFCPLDDGKTCVNGRLTLGENIGDLGGLSLAYRAYKMSLNGEEAPVIDGLTGDQRFFLSWAQVWRSKIREEGLRQRLLTDPHSPAEYRVNGPVRNIDAWYEAFNVSEDDEMYLPPEERVKIW